MPPLSSDPVELTVDSTEAGWRLDVFLAHHFPDYSRVHLRRVITAGGVQVEDRGGKPATTRFERDLQHRRPAAQHRPSQAEQQTVAVRGQAFDVEAVVLAGDRHEGAEVRIVGQCACQLVALRVAFQAQRAAAITGFAHEAWRALRIGLDRQASDQAPVGIEREF